MEAVSSCMGFSECFLLPSSTKSLLSMSSCIGRSAKSFAVLQKKRRNECIVRAGFKLDFNCRRPEVIHAIEKSLHNCLSETYLDESVSGLGPKIRGKVRDIYPYDDYLVLVTTDRISAFDRVLASVPFKGQVLNQTSLWWFEKTKGIVPNAIVSSPDPNVVIARKCNVFPVEFVVRGFLTGSTSTSLWTVYNHGVRNYCGNTLPDGLVKNQRLAKIILTPTTKSADHDIPISPDEIIEQGLMTKDELDEVSSKALSLFSYAQEVACNHGLLLVDTKYEFGKTDDGLILLIDEVHTPDSSRYWIANSYEEHLKQGLEPENIDKSSWMSSSLHTMTKANEVHPSSQMALDEYKRAKHGCKYALSSHRTRLLSHRSGMKQLKGVFAAMVPEQFQSV